MKSLFWTEDGKARNLASLSSTEHSELQAILLQTEAREWKMRFTKKSLEIGTTKARSWWNDTKLDLEKKRGKDGINTLVTEMNRQRHDDRRL